MKRWRRNALIYGNSTLGEMKLLESVNSFTDRKHWQISFGIYICHEPRRDQSGLRNKSNQPDIQHDRVLISCCYGNNRLFNNLLRFLSNTKLNETETRGEFSWIESLKTVIIVFSNGQQ